MWSKLLCRHLCVADLLLFSIFFCSMAISGWRELGARLRALGAILDLRLMSSFHYFVVFNHPIGPLHLLVSMFIDKTEASFQCAWLPWEMTLVHSLTDWHPSCQGEVQGSPFEDGGGCHRFIRSSSSRRECFLTCWSLRVNKVLMLMYDGCSCPGLHHLQAASCLCSMYLCL